MCVAIVKERPYDATLIAAKPLMLRGGYRGSMTPRFLSAVLALVAVLLAGACLAAPPGGRGGSTVGATPVPSPGASNGTSARPSVLILDPAFDGGVMVGTVTVKVRVDGFALAPPGGPSRPDEGHLIYYRDVVPATLPNRSALTAPGTCAASTETAYIWTGIAPGTHTFAVQLVHGDNTPLEPPALDAVDVTAVSLALIPTSSQGNI